MIELKTEWTAHNKKYAVVHVDNEIVGIVEIIDGGFISSGKRKPVNTLSKAAIQLIDRLIHWKKLELSKFEKLRNSIN